MAQRTLTRRLTSLLVNRANYCTHSNYGGEGGTTVSILNQDTGGTLFINSFGARGFRLNNGMTVLGPIALFPRSLIGWSVNSAEDLTYDSLSLFLNLEPKLDLLILGFGNIGDGASLPQAELAKAKAKGLHIEILPTEHAVTTFNFLNSERRYIAGAFIPPSGLDTSTTQEMIKEKLQRKKIRSEIDDEN